jgi:hypothetical protein
LKCVLEFIDRLAGVVHPVQGVEDVDDLGHPG